jgi:hypothetical protein
MQDLARGRFAAHAVKYSVQRRTLQPRMLIEQFLEGIAVRPSRGAKSALISVVRGSDPQPESCRSFRKYRTRTGSTETSSATRAASAFLHLRLSNLPRPSPDEFELEL